MHCGTVAFVTCEQAVKVMSVVVILANKTNNDTTLVTEELLTMSGNVSTSLRCWTENHHAVGRW